MKTKAQKGFTLVELMVAITTGTIVILAAGTVLVAGLIFLDKTWVKTNLQRDASYAMLRVSRSIKAASSAELESEGKAIKVYGEAYWTRFFLDEGNNSLKCEIEGGEPQMVVHDSVEDLEFTKEANRITIDLRLKKDDFQDHLVSTVMMRNYGG